MRNQVIEFLTTFAFIALLAYVVLMLFVIFQVIKIMLNLNNQPKKELDINEHN